MHKARSFIKCRHNKPVHGGANLFTLEGVEASPTIRLRNIITWLFYSRTEDYKLVGYSDSDWCGDIDDRKSTSGYVFFMGNTTFTWLSKKQPIVTLSTCEVEYVAVSWCVCHAIWLRNLLSKMELKQWGATVIQVDNKSAIELAKNPVNHERSNTLTFDFTLSEIMWRKKAWNCCMWQVRIKLQTSLQNRYRKCFSTNTRRWLAWQMVGAFKFMGEFCWNKLKCGMLVFVLNKVNVNFINWLC